MSQHRNFSLLGTNLDRVDLVWQVVGAARELDLDVGQQVRLLEHIVLQLLALGAEMTKVGQVLKDNGKEFLIESKQTRIPNSSSVRNMLKKTHSVLDEKRLSLLVLLNGRTLAVPVLEALNAAQVEQSTETGTVVLHDREVLVLDG